MAAFLAGVAFLFVIVCACLLYYFWKKRQGEEIVLPLIGTVLEADFSSLDPSAKTRKQPVLPQLPGAKPRPKLPTVGPQASIKKKVVATKVGSNPILSLPAARGTSLVMTYLQSDDIPTPKYWTKKGKKLRIGEPALRHQVLEKSLASVQVLMDGTWADIKTRDRKDFGGINRFQVVQVLRIENMELWRKYQHYRKHINAACWESELWKPHGVKTRELALDDEDLMHFYEKMELDADANEFLLFHGTKPSSAAGIVDAGFQVNLAGRKTGTLYGPGIYLAERSSKADEYAEDDREGLYQGLFAMLLCRATCGVMNVCEDVKPDVDRLVESIMSDGTYHSVLGDREKARGTYREFILFDSGQVYPEFIIIYRRFRQPTE